MLKIIPPISIGGISFLIIKKLTATLAHSGATAAKKLFYQDCIPAFSKRIIHLQFKQEAFSINPHRKARQLSAGTHYPVARLCQQQWIAIASHSHRTCSTRHSNARGNLAISGYLPIRDITKFSPHRQLKSCTLRSNGKCKNLAFATEVFIKFVSHLGPQGTRLTNGARFRSKRNATYRAAFNDNTQRTNWRAIDIKPFNLLHKKNLHNNANIVFPHTTTHFY